jgi:HTH-type transcriptional regulator / antitoxin HigA
MTGWISRRSMKRSAASGNNETLTDPVKSSVPALWDKELEMAASSKKTTAGRERDHYLELVRKFPLRPLRSDEELAVAIKAINSLIVRGDLDSGEQDYLDILTEIVEKYEAVEHPMPRVSDAAMLRHLIEARGINQSKLAGEVGISMSTISEVLNGKRRLNRNHIGVLAKFFRVPPSVFQI